MTWTQTYTPLGGVALSALAAAVPVVVLLGTLALNKIPAHFAALLGLLASILIVIGIFKMPALLAIMATVFGAAYGLFPIGWIVLCAIFVYDITVHTGQFEVIKQSVAGLADDRRIQTILIAFCFGAFIEGAAGFGTPVAICGAMLIGLGFRPLVAATLTLIGNTAPVAFGSLGTPIIALAGVTGIPDATLGAMVGRQLPLFSLIIPLWLVWTLAGFRKAMEVWPAWLVAGGTFAILQFVVSNNGSGPMLVDIFASLASIIALLVLLRFWQPKTTWRFEHEATEEVAGVEPPTVGQALRAWMPWLIVSVLVFTWGYYKAAMNKHTQIDLHVPMLDNAVLRDRPVVAAPKAEPAVLAFNWASATGTAMLLAGIIAGTLLGLSPMKLARTFGHSLYRVRKSLLTIAAMMAIGYVSRFGGLDATMGLAFAHTGRFFPFFSPLLGWLGVALTGSDTASNVLFGNLQTITARQLHFNPVIAAAANSSGGVMGKMIDAQSIVVAGVATGKTGAEGQILRRVFLHSIVLAVLVGLLVMWQARHS
jgi:lactate permease